MTNHFEVNMDEYLPLRDVVFKTLRQAILKGELEPGERLMEIQLAERLGVSRTPIREAIRKLELEGLVLMIPRKGAESDIKIDRGAVETSGNREQDSPASGIPYHQHAGGTGRTSLQLDPRREAQCSLL